MACRHDLTDVVKFSIEEVGSILRVRDDYGRTPLHDAFWTGEPNFTLIELLLKKEPDVLLMSDKRGHCPLEYVRKDHWGAWTEFLKSKSHLVKPREFAVRKCLSSGF